MKKLWRVSYRPRSKSDYGFVFVLGTSEAAAIREARAHLGGFTGKIISCEPAPTRTVLEFEGERLELKPC